MDTVRYVLTVLIVVTFPPICLFWFLVHPFANFWRKIDPWWTYGILFSLFFTLIFILYHFRLSLIGTDYGFQPILAIAGVFCWVVAVVIYLERRKHLTSNILLGYPEVSKNGYPGILLTKDIYGKMRHPRYVEIQFGYFGYALIANFLGLYILTILCIPALFLVVLLEEKELIERFGKDYAVYSQSVPRFIPKRINK